MTTRAPTLAELEGHLRTIAAVVDRYGEAYLPLFERIEAEVAAARGRSDSMSRARRILETTE